MAMKQLKAVFLFVLLLSGSCVRDGHYGVSGHGRWKLLAVGAGAAATIFGAPLALAGLGFTTAGITAGSIATWIMSLYGGTVLTGSVVAVLQSLGAAGMGSVATAIVGVIGATAGGATYDAFKEMLKDEDEKAELAKGLVACLMGPCGGNLNGNRVRAVAGVLQEDGYHGINAIRNEAEKLGVKKCIKIMKMMAIMASQHKK